MTLLEVGERTIHQLPCGVHLSPLEQHIREETAVVCGVERRMVDSRIVRPLDVLLGSQQLARAASAAGPLNR